MILGTLYDPDNLVAAALGGGRTGIYRVVGTEGAVAPEAPYSLYVTVPPFTGCANQHTVRCSGARLGPVTVPAGGSPGDLRRIDLVQYTYGVGLNIKAGTEDVAPVAPSADGGSIPLATIHCRRGMTVVKATDDTANAWIVDYREFL